MKKIFLGLIFSAIIYAQPSIPSVVFVTVDPAGACTANSALQYNTTNGNLWGCDSLVWTKSGSAGGGGVPGGSLGCVQLYATATTFAGCVGTVALIGPVDVGFPGEVLSLDSPTVTASAGIQFAQNYDLNLVANETGQHIAHYGILNMNGTVNYPNFDAALWGALNVGTTGTVGAAGVPVSGAAGQVALLATTTGGVVTGLYGSCVGGFSAVLSTCSGVWGSVSPGGGSTITNASDFYAQAPSPAGLQIFFGFFSEALGGTATQAFPEWYDERGVWAIHSINSFNAVYQARPALYNPQFTKFSLAQLNANSYERGVCQWESNEYWCRTEAGAGGGTARRFGIGALAGFDLSTNDVANPLTLPKMSVAAGAPGATKADIRVLAGTNAGTCKVVVNAGTSATEITIVDNVGTGC